MNEPEAYSYLLALEYSDPVHIYAATAIFIATLIYYLITWQIAGRDPEPGFIQPGCEIPEGISAAEAGFLMNIRICHRALSTLLIEMAIKEYINIIRTRHGYFLERKYSRKRRLNAEEKIVDKHLFGKKKKIRLSNVNWESINRAIEHLTKHLKASVRKGKFRYNYRYARPGILCMIAMNIVMLNLCRPDQSIGIIFCIPILSVPYLMTGMISERLYPRMSRMQRYIYFSFIVFAYIMLTIIIASKNNTPFLHSFLPVYWLNALFLTMIWGFYHLLKAPTAKGRKIMDQLESLKLFMSSPEEISLELKDAPERACELFEKLLPYAIAIEVDKAWTANMKEHLTRLMKQHTYQPQWHVSADRKGMTDLPATIWTSNFIAAVNAATIRFISRKRTSIGSRPINRYR